MQKKCMYFAWKLADIITKTLALFEVKIDDYFHFNTKLLDYHFRGTF